MTTVYFVRHSTAENSNLDTRNRGLTEKGSKDCSLVTEFLADKQIDIIYTSPYRRTIETLTGFATQYGFNLNLVEDFKERLSIGTRLSEYELKSYYEAHWKDFSYSTRGEECFGDTQKRNIEALNIVLTENENMNIVIGTHGIALATIINHYDNTFGFSDYWDMLFRLPWIVKADFNSHGCVGMEKIDLFHQETHHDSQQMVTGVYNLNSLKAYRFVVILSQYNGKWVYSRAKARDSYEAAGGHIEEGETPLQAAKRELYEETGATDFEISPMFDYTVHTPSEYSNGQVFYANIKKFDDMPAYEMAEIKLFDTIPDNMRFPKILPILFDTMQKHLANI